MSLKVFKILISKYLLESHCVLMPNLKYSPSDEYYSQISTIINNAIMKIFVHGDVYKSMIISKNLIKLEQLNEKYILKYCFLQYYFLRKILSFLMFPITWTTPDFFVIFTFGTCFFFPTTLVFMYCRTLMIIGQLASIIYFLLILVLIPSTYKLI